MHLFIFIKMRSFFFWVPNSVCTRAIRKAVRALIVSSEETLQEELTFCSSLDGLLQYFAPQ